MEESPSSTVWGGKITGIKFGLDLCVFGFVKIINWFWIGHGGFAFGSKMLEDLAFVFKILTKGLYYI